VPKLRFDRHQGFSNQSAIAHAPCRIKSASQTRPR
jgi:hypothetical protein